MLCAARMLANNAENCAREESERDEDGLEKNCITARR